MNILYYIYILTNKTRSVFYIGVTRDLLKRLEQHHDKIINGFTKKYNTNILIYFEEYSYINEAIIREKKLKNWHRLWKLNLIKTKNPTLRDLSEDWKETGSRNKFGMTSK